MVRSGSCGIGCGPERTTSRSKSSNAAFRSTPPPYPVSFPEAPITRWHGTTIEIGLRPLARPTALDEPGDPMRFASSPYEIVSPYGILRSSSQTVC